MTKVPLIAIVDDDQSLRESLKGLLRSHGYESAVYPSAYDFLRAEAQIQADCLILDVYMPGMSGPELKYELTRRGQKIPIIFITAHGDENTARLKAAGAVDCLLKPFSEESLLKAINRAYPG